MYTITPKRVHSLFCEINFLLSAGRRHFAVDVRTTWKVDRVCYRLLNGSAYSASVHNVLRVQ
jgi:hypothetical protein